jgi:heme exporter protein D
MTFPPLLAHLGHWYLWVPYAIPVVVVLAASVHALRQQRKEDRERENSGKPLN